MQLAVQVIQVGREAKLSHKNELLMLSFKFCFEKQD